MPVFIGAVAVAITGNLAVLLTLSAPGVRAESDLIGFYLTIVVVALVLAIFAFEYFGISFRDDLAARRNPAAAAGVCGLILGEAFCLAGSNSGDGPGPEAVFFSAAISTAALFVEWLVFAAFSGAVELISVERDLACGLRSAAFLMGSGAILGGSIAGDWVSFKQTLTDFARFGWPTIPLLALGIIAERVLRRRGLIASAVYGAAIFAGCVIYGVRIWRAG